MGSLVVRITSISPYPGRSLDHALGLALDPRYIEECLERIGEDGPEEPETVLETLTADCEVRPELGAHARRQSERVACPRSAGCPGRPSYHVPIMGRVERDSPQETRPGPSGPPPLGRQALLYLLWRRFGERRAMATYVTVSGFISVVLVTFAAYLIDTHFIFPALGPTIFLVFSHPTSPRSSPRSVALGHLVGYLCGWGSLTATGLLGKGPVLTEGSACPAWWP